MEDSMQISTKVRTYHIHSQAKWVVYAPFCSEMWTI